MKGERSSLRANPAILRGKRRNLVEIGTEIHGIATSPHPKKPAAPRNDGTIPLPGLFSPLQLLQPQLNYCFLIIILSHGISDLLCTSSTLMNDHLPFFTVYIKFERLHQCPAATFPVSWNFIVHMLRIQALCAVIPAAPYLLRHLNPTLTTAKAFISMNKVLLLLHSSLLGAGK